MVVVKSTFFCKIKYIVFDARKDVDHLFIYSYHTISISETGDAFNASGIITEFNNDKLNFVTVIIGECYVYVRGKAISYAPFYIA